MLTNGLANLNPYFIGLSILIRCSNGSNRNVRPRGLNPYFIGLSILIASDLSLQAEIEIVSILILLDYLFL